MSCAVLSPEPFGMLCLLQNNWINNQHLINSKPRLDVCSSIFISTFPKAQRLSCYLSGDFHADFGGPTTWAFRLLHRGCRPPHRDTACSCYLNPRLEKLEVPGPWGHWLSNIIQVGLLHEWWENLQQQHIMPWHNVVICCCVDQRKKQLKWRCKHHLAHLISHSDFAYLPFAPKLVPKGPWNWSCSVNSRVSCDNATFYRSFQYIHPSNPQNP